jgi:hypothetical protein
VSKETCVGEGDAELERVINVKRDLEIGLFKAKEPHHGEGVGEGDAELERVIVLVKRDLEIGLFQAKETCVGEGDAELERVIVLVAATLGELATVGSVKRDQKSVKRGLVGVKRDLVGVKRDLVGVKRDLVCCPWRTCDCWESTGC